MRRRWLCREGWGHSTTLSRISLLTNSADGEEDRDTLGGRRARGARRVMARNPHSAARRADQPSRSAPIECWRRNSDLRSAMVIISHDRRFSPIFAPDGLDRPGRDQEFRPGFWRIRGLRDLQSRRRAQQHSSTGRSHEEHWLRYGVTARRKRNQTVSPGSKACARTGAIS